MCLEQHLKPGNDATRDLGAKVQTLGDFADELMGFGALVSAVSKHDIEGIDDLLKKGQQYKEDACAHLDAAKAIKGALTAS